MVKLELNPDNSAHPFVVSLRPVLFLNQLNEKKGKELYLRV